MFCLEKLSQLGAKMIVEFIPNLIQGEIKSIPQDHSQATYCKPVKREDGKIDWKIQQLKKFFASGEPIILGREFFQC